MYKRNLYIEKIRPYIEKPVVKVITGMRRAGKSCFLQLIMNELNARKVTKKSILYINKESLDYDFIQDYRDLNRYVIDSFSGVKGTKYLFVDEIQEIEHWEKTIASFYSDSDFDIYITGSNAHILSSEIATLISGRYIEIPVYSLSFEEFLLFRDKRTKNKREEFSTYLWAGGFPAIHHFDFNQEVVYQYISSIYNTILLKDVIKRNNVRNVTLLENITRYIFQNVGNIFTAKKVSDYLKSQKLRVSIDTVQNYISYLISTFAVFKVPRFDVKGKRILELHEKYYLGDVSLRHALLGYREGDISGVLENLVFLELKRRGYHVFIGKAGNKEIDFIAEKENRKIYIQVAYLLASPETIEREFSVLKMLKDNYPKYVISMDEIFGKDIDGIQRINLVDFLLNPEI
ncbi:MAG: ATP-binding protein [Deltaproteobacteria bacterium]|nr:ATP-binding protein [Deltaproteobacteria bacterium]